MISGGSVVITHCPGVVSVMSGGCMQFPQCLGVISVLSGVCSCDYMLSGSNVHPVQGGLVQ